MSAAAERDGVVRLLEAFGDAIRGDWTQDGRSVRMAMRDATAAVLAGVDPDKALHDNGVCPVNNCWDEHCPDTTDDAYPCPHDSRAPAAAGSTEEKKQP